MKCSNKLGHTVSLQACIQVALGSGEKLAALRKFRRDCGAAEDEAHRIRTALQAISHAVQEERVEQASLKEQLEQHVQSAGHRCCQSVLKLAACSQSVASRTVSSNLWIQELHSRCK